MTQAVMFPSSSPAVTAFLRHVTEKRRGGSAPPIDLLMDSFVKDNRERYSAYLAVGDFFRHVGYYSSVDKREHHDPREFIL